jgi:polysaccharide chain length determinant protein (PEP-CTERM system associated)
MQNEFDYRKYLSLLNKHKRLFAFTALVIMTGVLVYSYQLPKEYRSQSTVFIEKTVLNDLVKGIAVTPSQDDLLRGLYTTIKSRALLTKVANDLDLNLNKQSDAHLEATISRLRNKTELTLDGNVGLIIFSFTDNNPRFARDYVNALVRRYIEENLSSKREESYGATSFISEQSASIKQKLEKVNDEIGRLKAEKGAALASDPVGMQTQIKAEQERLNELIIHRSQVEATRNQLRNNNPTKNRLAALQRRLEELRVDYTDNYPEVLKVKTDIEAAKKEITIGDGTSVADPQELSRIELELNAIRASEANQRSILASTRGLTQANPSAVSAMEKLLQEKNRYSGMYDQLVAKHGQAEFSNQMEAQDKSATFRIVEPALMPTLPVGPNRVRIILIGIAAGIAAGFGLLLVIDYFDKSVKTVDTLKTLGINVLAVIPKISDPQAIDKERRGDLRLYLLSGSYFSMIVALLALEFLGMTPVDRIIGLIQG